jgi:hypothetical protein
LEAFKFLGDHPFVFVHCHVLVCDAKDPHSRCKKGCISGNPGGHLPHGHPVAKKQPNKKQGNKKQGHAIRKRDVRLSSLNKMASVTLSQGPFLVDEETRKESKRGEIPKPRITQEKGMNQIVKKEKKEKKETDKADGKIVFIDSLVGISQNEYFKI